MRSSSASTCPVPCAAITPNSAACPRSALTSWVCCFTRSSRPRRQHHRLGLLFGRARNDKAMRVPSANPQACAPSAVALNISLTMLV